MFGLQIQFSKYMSDGEPQYPQDRFVEYERSDVWWLVKYYGMSEPKDAEIIQMGNTLVMHPKVYERMKVEISKRGN